MRLEDLKLITLILLLGFCTTTFAQDRTITGKVITEDGPLPGASVVQKGTSNGTVTDFDGNFTLNLLEEEPPVLVISYVGFVPKEVQLGANQRRRRRA